MSRYETNLHDVGYVPPGSAAPPSGVPLPDQVPPSEDLPYYLESFERSVPDTTLPVSSSRLLHALNLRTLWAWARQETVPVPRDTYVALLEDRDTLQADNRRLREALTQAREATASAEAHYKRLDAEVEKVLRDLIAPWLTRP